MIDTDISDLNALAVDLSRAGIGAAAKALVAVEESSRNIEEQARDLAPRKHLPHYAKTITHDVTIVGPAIVGEIGPDKDVNGQARLGHIFEYGTATLGPRAHLGPSFDRELPDFVDRLSDAGDVL